MRIGIVGLGLIGGSLAAALTAAGHQVAGHDLDWGSEETALGLGFVRELAPTGYLARESDVVVLCLPVEATIEAVGEVAPLMRPETILTDVASVKRPVVAAMNAVEAECRCVGGHPIAGKEISGIDAANADLFSGAAYAVVPTDKSDQDAIETLKGLVSDVHAGPVEIDAGAHDAMLARTSHLAQAVSSAMSLYLNGAREDPLKGPGIQGMLRLAHSDEKLWTEIFVRNSDNVAASLRGFASTLERLTDSIETQDKDGIESLMRTGRKLS